ncbi:MAG TPA: hypothetical protein VIK72_05570 [Clostridiaceae bacterium]
MGEIKVEREKKTERKMVKILEEKGRFEDRYFGELYYDFGGNLYFLTCG